MHITQTPITYPAHNPLSQVNERRVILMHATAGSFPGDHIWLRKGGNAAIRVSVHYLVAPDGRIFQYLPDSAIAWHAGQSVATIDGVKRSNINPYAIGIELSNPNDGKTPYPAVQIGAAVELATALSLRYDIPRDQLLRHVDVSHPRKNDPRGLAWGDFVERVYPSGSPAILDTTSINLDRAVGLVSAASNGYTEYDVRLILEAYKRLAVPLGVSVRLAVAQMLHETGGLTSFWARREQRNPAGIGVTGAWSRVWLPGYAYNDQRRRWEQGVSFATWVSDAIPAHLGRLLAYALPVGKGTLAQQQSVSAALRVRGLPEHYRGAALTLRGLQGTWAMDTQYERKVMAWYERL